MLVEPADIPDLLPGYEASESNVSLAHLVIESYADPNCDLLTITTSEQTTIFSTRDLRNLKRAIIFQAIWLEGQPNYTTESVPEEQDQDGVVIKAANPSTLTLAPLAARCLIKLSWKSGSRHVRDQGRKRNGNPNRFDYDDNDGCEWQPLPGW